MSSHKPPTTDTEIERLDKILNEYFDYEVYGTRELVERIKALLAESERKGYERGVADEIECVETSGEHLDLQNTLKDHKEEA